MKASDPQNLKQAQESTHTSGMATLYISALQEPSSKAVCVSHGSGRVRGISALHFH